MLMQRVNLLFKTVARDNLPSYSMKQREYIYWIIRVEYACVSMDISSQELPVVTYTHKSQQTDDFTRTRGKICKQIEKHSCSWGVKETVNVNDTSVLCSKGYYSSRVFCNNVSTHEVKTQQKPRQDHNYLPTTWWWWWYCHKRRVLAVAHFFVAA